MSQPATPTKEPNDIQELGVNTPSTTNKLSDEDVKESKNIRDYNIDLLQQYIEKYQISISQATEHFFSNKWNLIMIYLTV